MRRNDADNTPLAFLTTAYPSVSHTFIRREILELERLGYSVFRVAIRRGSDVVDPVDQAEASKTLHLLAQPLSVLMSQIAGGMLRARLRVLPALWLAWKLSRASDRGALRHLAYWVEALALIAILRKQGVCHVHVHFGTNAAAVAMLVSAMGGPGFSMAVHGPDEFDSAIGFSLGRKLQAARFTAAISHFCASQLKRWVEFDQWSKIRIVGCTVGEEWFEAGVPIHESADTILSIGRLSAQKGQLLLINAFAAAIDRGFDGRLVIIGDGELRSVIEEQIESLGIGHRVDLRGWCSGEEVRDALVQSRALVLPSFAEGLPVVLMESMALQRPVVTTYVAGIPELIENCKHGWLVPAGDQDALVNALMDLGATSLTDLRDMGAAAADMVRQTHHVVTEVGKLDALFRAFTPIGAMRSSEQSGSVALARNN